MTAASSAPLLEVEDLHKHYPVRGGVWGRQTGQHPGRGRRQLPGAEGPDTGAGGRVGLRQVHARAAR